MRKDGYKKQCRIMLRVLRSLLPGNTNETVSYYLNEIAKELKGYDVTVKISRGQAGEEILKAADEFGTDLIVMTKSTKKGWTQTIGSVTAYCVKYARCIVVIAPENTAE